MTVFSVLFRSTLTVSLIITSRPSLYFWDTPSLDTVFLWLGFLEDFSCFVFPPCLQAPRVNILAKENSSLQKLDTFPRKLGKLHPPPPPRKKQENDTFWPSPPSLFLVAIAATVANEETQHEVEKAVFLFVLCCILCLSIESRVSIFSLLWFSSLLGKKKRKKNAAELNCWAKRYLYACQKDNWNWICAQKAFDLGWTNVHTGATLQHLKRNGEN